MTPIHGLSTAHQVYLNIIYLVSNTTAAILFELYILHQLLIHQPISIRTYCQPHVNDTLNYVIQGVNKDSFHIIRQLNRADMILSGRLLPMKCFCGTTLLR